MVGLALSYALSVTSRLSGVITSFTETEKQMVAVERQSHYIANVPHVRRAVLNVIWWLCAFIFRDDAAFFAPNQIGKSVKLCIQAFVATALFNFTVAIFQSLKCCLFCLCFLSDWLNNKLAFLQERSAPLRKHQIPIEWPQRGGIEFRLANLQYRKNLPIALDDVSFTIRKCRRLSRS